jgi:hypothetical protein
VHSDDPIMAMQPLTFAGVGEREAVGRRHLHPFDNCIHSSKFGL